MNPHPPAFHQRLARLGWVCAALAPPTTLPHSWPACKNDGNWVPTPEVTDEDQEFYVTLGEQHYHIMSIEEAMKLSDVDLFRRIEEVCGMSIEAMCEQYGVEA